MRGRRRRRAIKDVFKLPPSSDGHHTRLLDRLSVAVAVVALAAAVTSFFQDDMSGVVTLGVMTAIAALTPALNRTLKSSWIAGQLVIGTSYAVVILLAAFGGGGLQSPVIHTLAAILAFAALISHRHIAIFWVILCLLTPMLVFTFLDSGPITRFPQTSLLTLNMASLTAGIGFVALILLTYKANEQQQRELIEKSRSEALQARQEAMEAHAQAESATQAKSSFLATMSHEMRTPLTAVIGIAELLEEDPTSPNAPRQLSRLKEAGQTLLYLIDDILDLSRIESGSLELDPIPLDIDSVVSEVHGILEDRASRRSVTLRCHHSGDAFILADPLRLRQILLNLLDNAIKFTEDGEVELSSKTTPGSRDHELNLTLTVRDSGIGIPKDAQARIFTPFTQADQSTARRSGGTGLGLSIVSRLVQMMNGKVDLVSAPGQGTTVTIELTVPKALSPLTASTQETVDEEPRLKVLLAEDNEILRLVLSSMLEKLHCEVETVEDGMQAVSTVTKNPDAYDLILMDCRMPNMDGYEATRRLRAASWTKTIIALTANATPEVRTECLEAGMNNFCSKPLTLPELRAVLREHGLAKAS